MIRTTPSPIQRAGDIPIGLRLKGQLAVASGAPVVLEEDERKADAAATTGGTPIAAYDARANADADDDIDTGPGRNEDAGWKIQYARKTHSAE